MNRVDPLFNIRSGPADQLISPANLVKAATSFVKRRMLIIGAATGIALLFGMLYLVNKPYIYTAQTRILIDRPDMQLFQQQTPIGNMALDVGTIESQVELLKSESLANTVVNELKLAHEPEFVQDGGRITALKRSFYGMFSTPTQPSETALLRGAVDKLRSKLRVYRVGLTYVIAIDYGSTDPRRAAEVADSLANAYIADDLNAKFEATQRASVWLQERIANLREQASAAERMVVEYKTKNNIVEDGGGRLLDRQQLAEINTQLVLARAQTAESRARLDRVRQILASSNVSGATVTDQLKSDVVNALRTRYLEYAAREADWSTRFGPNHMAAINARNQMKEIETSIESELKRLEQVYTSDLEIARQREDSLQTSMDQAVVQSQTTNEAQVTLNELQSSAQSSRTLYDTFLKRYMETIQQQSFPISDARIISHAQVPTWASEPKAKLILLGSLMAGLILGVAIAAMRDLADRAFRFGEQVENDLRMDCIAIVPRAPEPDAKRKASGRGNTLNKQISAGSSPAWTVVEKPFSRFAEAIRAVKLSIDSASPAATCHVVGLTSSLPGEGKSTVATAIALLLAQSGAKTLLIDGDLRNPTLTRTLSRKAKTGLVDVIKGTGKLKDEIWTDPETGLSFLPSFSRVRPSFSSDMFGSENVKTLFAKLREQYQYVIVDLPPLAPVVDVRATYKLIDSYLFVVEWGKTKCDVAEYALDATPCLQEKIIGAILNKADLRAISRYDDSVKDYFSGKDYAAYGYTD